MQVEKVSYNVNWKNFRRGTSFFVPCLNPKQARKEITVVVKRLKYQVVTKAVIEDGIKGLRVWRI
jgi:hypothetical protein